MTSDWRRSRRSASCSRQYSDRSRREFEFLIGVFHFRNKLNLPEDVFDEKGRGISEELQEIEEVEAWRRKHKESVRRQRLKEKQERAQWKLEGNDDLNKKFEELEMMEDLANDFETLGIDNDKLARILSGEIIIPEAKPRIAHNLGSSPLVIQAIKNNATESELLKAAEESQEPNEAPMKTTEINNNDLITQSNHEIVDLLKTYRSKIKDVLKNVRKDDERSLNLFLDLIELKDDIEDDIRKMNDDEDAEYSESEKDSDDETTVSIEADQSTTKRKVRFSTSLEDVKLIENKEHYQNDHTSDSQTIQILFQHSDARFTGMSTSSDVIAHPGEIHKVFTPPAPVTATKSILKHRLSSDLTSPEEPRPPKKVFQSDFQAIGDVREHSKMEITEESVVEIAAKDEPPKKISRFRQMRLKS